MRRVAPVSDVGDTNLDTPEEASAEAIAPRRGLPIADVSENVEQPETSDQPEAQEPPAISEPSETSEPPETSGPPETSKAPKTPEQSTSSGQPKTWEHVDAITITKPEPLHDHGKVIWLVVFAAVLIGLAALVPWLINRADPPPNSSPTAKGVLSKLELPATVGDYQLDTGTSSPTISVHEDGLRTTSATYSKSGIYKQQVIIVLSQPVHDNFDVVSQVGLTQVNVLNNVTCGNSQDYGIDACLRVEGDVALVALAVDGQSQEDLANTVNFFVDTLK